MQQGRITQQSAARPRGVSKDRNPPGNDSDQWFIYSKRSIKAGWEEGEGGNQPERTHFLTILAPPTKDAKQEVRKEGEKETLFPLKHHVWPTLHWPLIRTRAQTKERLLFEESSSSCGFHIPAVATPLSGETHLCILLCLSNALQDLRGHPQEVRQRGKPSSKSPKTPSKLRDTRLRPLCRVKKGFSLAVTLTYVIWSVLRALGVEFSQLM